MLSNHSKNVRSLARDVLTYSFPSSPSPKNHCHSHQHTNRAVLISMLHIWSPCYTVRDCGSLILVGVRARIGKLSIMMHYHGNQLLTEGT